MWTKDMQISDVFQVVLKQNEIVSIDKDITNKAVDIHFESKRFESSGHISKVTIWFLKKTNYRNENLDFVINKKIWLKAGFEPAI